MLYSLFRANKRGESQIDAGKKNFCFLFAILVGFSALLMLSSCQKVDKPYLPFTPVTPPVGDTIRKVLFEDYTGHRCPNCPKAAYAIHNFQETLFPRQVIALAIHSSFGGGLTAPDASHPSDFRTALGDKYFTDFGVPVLPTGIINRRNKASGYDSGPDDHWVDTIQNILSKSPDAFLKIMNTYDTATGKLNSSVTCTFLNTLTGTYNLVVLLTQDSIVSPQDNSNIANYPPYASPIATNYVHMHVLRDCIDGSGTNGTGISVGPFTKGISVTKNMPEFLMPASYPVGAVSYGVPVVAKNCNVVAFIYNTTTNEVVQAEEQKIQ
jgi:hypothetical protein